MWRKVESWDEEMKDIMEESKEILHDPTRPPLWYRTCDNTSLIRYVFGDPYTLEWMIELLIMSDPVLS